MVSSEPRGSPKKAIGSDRGYIGISEKRMETTIVHWDYVLGLYWGYIEIMEKKMETIGNYCSIVGYILGLSWNNGKREW